MHYRFHKRQGYHKQKRFPVPSPNSICPENSECYTQSACPICESDRALTRHRIIIQACENEIESIEASTRLVKVRGQGLVDATTLVSNNRTFILLTLFSYVSMSDRLVFSRTLVRLFSSVILPTTEVCLARSHCTRSLLTMYVANANASLGTYIIPVILPTTELTLTRHYVCGTTSYQSLPIQGSLYRELESIPYSMFAIGRI